MNDWSDEETHDPLYADDRNFYKVELWTKDEQRVLHMLYAGNDLDKRAPSWATTSGEATPSEKREASGRGGRRAHVRAQGRVVIGFVPYDCREEQECQPLTNS